MDEFTTVTKILKIVSKLVVSFCLIFTFATLASCIINLILGQDTDTYVHILDRAALCLLGAAILNWILYAEWKGKIVRFIIPYLVFMPLVFLYLFIKGFVRDLHPNAYRDIFLNDTIAYLVAYAVLLIMEKCRKN